MAFARSKNDIAAGIDAAPHLERINRVEVGVAIGAIMPIDQEGSHNRATLPEGNCIGKNVGAAGLGPLIRVRDPSTSGNQQLNGPSARGEDLVPYINQPLRWVAVGRRLLRSEEHTSELQSLRHLVC